ncbi:MAG: hypothetical protein GC160_00905 [Acidobacteria bacterium]|nr:hypothetical protein [Acidobacteriota bacterium]
MLATYATAIAVVVLLLFAWVAIQSAWGRRFPETDSDPDVLARRLDCAGCGCLSVCRRQAPSRHLQEKSS